MRWEMECVLRKGVGLRKRTGPSISYRIVGRWYRGDKFIAVDVKTVGKYTWYKIEGTSYWSCGKEGSAIYLKKIRDLDPPKPPDPPKEPSKPTPKPEPPEPPYVPPTFNTNPLNPNWAVNPTMADWYAPSSINFKSWDSDKYNAYTTNHGRWDIVSDKQIQEEMRRIRYNMDIAYMKKSEIADYSGSTGYFTDLQAKIHNSFNRNKTAFPDYTLTKTFAYVFFTRPDLNIASYSDGKWSLSKQARVDTKYDYIMKNNPNTIKSLVGNGNPHHKFLVLLSNEAKSFEVSDHVLKTVEHGETYTGGKIIYGKSDHESNSAGEISIRYVDSVNLDIFKLHTIWVDYINKVYRGIFSPKREYIQNRILDYASSCYYILCGPDGSTILYWQKLTGVFPVNTGENAFSWDSGTLLSKPEINIKYMYSMKTPMDVAQLNEINNLSGYKAGKKVKSIYSNDNCATGSTLTHAPCIVESSIGGKFCYRLMWMDE